MVVGELKCVVTVWLWMKALAFVVRWAAKEAGAFLPGL